METATTAFRGTGPTEDQVRHFHQPGWLLTRTLENPAAVERLGAWIDDIASWPDDGGWLHHREQTDEILELFEHWGAHRYDEELSQLEHALQTASHARTAGADDALVAAALLHDTGHLLELRAGGAVDGATEGDLAHEATGARWLARVFPAAVTAPIALHVEAKRYRCSVDPGYWSTLSIGSMHSLDRQGGPMSAGEVTRFEAHPAGTQAVALRGWDDGGKVPGQPLTNGLEDLRHLLDGLVAQAHSRP